MTAGLVVAACGGARPPTDPVALAAFDPARHLLSHAEASTAVFAPRREPESELSSRLRRATSSAERRELQRALAAAKLRTAEGAETPKAARKLRNDAAKLARLSLKHEDDPFHRAEAEFLLLVGSWRAGSPQAVDQAARFTDRHKDSVELLALAWAIRGEAAIERRRWREASLAYRYPLGQLDHPLYVLALLRTAAILDAEGRKGEAEQARKEARDMGCRRDLPELSRVAALAAAGELGERGREDPDDVVRPASCPVGGTVSGPADDLMAR